MNSFTNPGLKCMHGVFFRACGEGCDVPQDYEGHNTNRETRCPDCNGTKFRVEMGGAETCPTCKGSGLKS